MISKNSSLFRLLLLTVSSLCSALPTFADSAGQTPARKPSEPEKQKSYFFSSLLPKAFQAHPLLAISVITEMTEEGKKLSPPTKENPGYYYCDFRYHEEGHAVSDNEKASKENLQKLAQNSLALNHYLPTDKQHPATLILFFLWGVHAKLGTPDYDNDDPGFEDLGHRNLLSRAALVGGTKFAKELEQALKDKDRNLMGGPLIMDPVYRFGMHSDLNRNLLEQVIDDCFYVVISAYDGAALAHGEKKLLWRTKMSTPSQGVSLVETIPGLVASGGPYFGREMSGPTIVDKRINRKGNVGLGELKVIEMDGKPVEKSDKDAPATKK